MSEEKETGKLNWKAMYEQVVSENEQLRNKDLNQILMGRMESIRYNIEKEFTPVSNKLWEFMKDPHNAQAVISLSLVTYLVFRCILDLIELSRG